MIEQEKRDERILATDLVLLELVSPFIQPLPGRRELVEWQWIAAQMLIKALQEQRVFLTGAKRE